MTEPRLYRGLARDQRVEQRRAALVESALDRLHADGLAGASVRSICAAARLTPRYFYESFADLDELLVAVVDSVLDEVAHRAVAAMSAAPGDLAAQVRAAIDDGYAVVADDRRKATALLVAASGHGPLRDRRHRAALEFADIALASLPRLGQLADRRTSRATALFLMGGSFELIEAVLSDSLRLSRTRVVDELTAMWVAVLER